MGAEVFGEHEDTNDHVFETRREKFIRLTFGCSGPS